MEWTKQRKICNNGRKSGCSDWEDDFELKKIGKTLFQLDESKGTEETLEYGGVRQGFLEGSNVNAVKVMTDLIEVQRGYESYQKMIRTMGEMASRVISGVGTME